MFSKISKFSIIFAAIFTLFPVRYTILEDANISRGNEFPVVVSPVLTFDTDPSREYMSGVAASDPVTITGFPVRTSHSKGCAACHELKLYPVGFVIDVVLGSLAGWGFASVIRTINGKRNNK